MANKRSNHGFTEFNPYMHMCLERPVIFDKEMELLAVDMDKHEVPNLCVDKTSSPWTRDLFSLVTFIHRVFSAKRLPSKLFLIQKELPQPGNDTVRVQNIDGYILVGAFCKENIETYFSTLCKLAITMNNGFMNMDSILDRVKSLEDLKLLMDSCMDVKTGVMSGGKRKKTNQAENEHGLTSVGNFKDIMALDRSLEQYHHYFIDNTDSNEKRCRVIDAIQHEDIVTDNGEVTENDLIDDMNAWEERLKLLKWQYLLQHSSRQKKAYETLHSIGKLLVAKAKSDKRKKNRGNAICAEIEDEAEESLMNLSSQLSRTTIKKVLSKTESMTILLDMSNEILSHINKEASEMHVENEDERNQVTENDGHLQRRKANEEKQHALIEVFLRHVRWLEWDSIIYRQPTPNILPSFCLNLTDRIAWDITESKDDFTCNAFYMIHADELLLTKVFKENCLDGYHTRKGKLLAQQFVTRLTRDSQKMFLEYRDRHREELYPVINHLKNDLFENFAESLNQDGRICRLYQDPALATFFLEKYTTEMQGSKEQSETRKLQYMSQDHLFDMFKEGFLNSTTDKQGHKRVIISAKYDNKYREPIQDAIANFLKTVLGVAGVRQMGVDMILILIGNILSFTTKANKSICVITGSSGIGKSYMVEQARTIMTYANPLACQKEDYSTFRSHTVPCSERRYENVLGTKFINEWAADKSMMENTSVEATIMKNIFDEGKCKSERATKSKDRFGRETFVKQVDIALDDRSQVILANGFNACSSFLDRCVVFHVPASRKGTINTTVEEQREHLQEAYIPQVFALIRYLITERTNKEATGLSLSHCDTKIGVTKEMELTLERLRFILEKMGFNSNIVLTQRKKRQIIDFANALALFRAVCEVYGCIHKSAHPEPPKEDESIEDYNDRMVLLMEKHLERKSQHEKDLLLAQRVLVDPADILASATLLLQLSQPETDIFDTICMQLAVPNVYNTEEIDGHTYIRIDNMTLRILAEIMRASGHGVLEEVLESQLVLIEDKCALQNTPHFIRKYDTTTNGINKNRNKQDQHFSMFILPSSAAHVYVRKHPEKVKECEEAFCEAVIKSEEQKLKKLVSQMERKRAVDDSSCDEEEHCPCIPRRSELLQVERFNAYVLFSVPSSLDTAFYFLKHVQVESSEGNVVSKINNGQTEVHQEFGHAGTKVLQLLLTNIFISAYKEGQKIPSFEDSFMQVRLTSHFLKRVNGNALDTDSFSFSMQPLLVGDRKVHVAIFNNTFDHEIPTVNNIRKCIVKDHLMTKKFAKNNYFEIEENNCELIHLLTQAKSVLEQKFVSRSEYLVKVTTLEPRMFVSYLFFNKVCETTCTTEKKSKSRELVERCLCENMTDLKSVMYFDREKLYETQIEEDAVDFVVVEQAAKELYGGKLPRWKCELPRHVRDTSNLDLYSQVILNKTDRSIGKYEHDHRQKNLAVLKMMADNKLNKLIEQTEARRFQNIEEKRRFFEVGYDKEVELAKQLTMNVAPLQDMRKDKESKFAKDVYGTAHPVRKMYRTNRFKGKRKQHEQWVLTDDDMSSHAKRHCNGV
jgi:hypothetical protein